MCITNEELGPHSNTISIIDVDQYRNAVKGKYVSILSEQYSIALPDIAINDLEGNKYSEICKADFITLGIGNRGLSCSVYVFN